MWWLLAVPAALIADALLDEDKRATMASWVKKRLQPRPRHMQRQIGGDGSTMVQVQVAGYHEQGRGGLDYSDIREIITATRPPPSPPPRARLD